MKMLNRLLVAVLLLSVFLTACSQPTAEPQTATEAPTEEVVEAEPTDVPATEPTDAPSDPATCALPTVDPGSVTGDVVSAGSATGCPMAEACAAEFADEGYNGHRPIASSG